jgi:hypothetical protein
MTAPACQVVHATRIDSDCADHAPCFHQSDRLLEPAADLVRRRVAVIVATPGAAISAATGAGLKCGN